MQNPTSELYASIVYRIKIIRRLLSGAILSYVLFCGYIFFLFHKDLSLILYILGCFPLFFFWARLQYQTIYRVFLENTEEAVHEHSSLLHKKYRAVALSYTLFFICILIILIQMHMASLIDVSSFSGAPLLYMLLVVGFSVFINVKLTLFYKEEKLLDARALQVKEKLLLLDSFALIGLFGAIFLLLLIVAGVMFVAAWGMRNMGW